jgi:hypothetical protein
VEKIFALYDSDLFYATRFMEYLKKRKDFNFEVAAFTKPESFFEFLQEHQIEILLLESKFNLMKFPRIRSDLFISFLKNRTSKRIRNPLKYLNINQRETSFRY